MKNENQGKAGWLRWTTLAIILAAQLIILLIAPEEKTLGVGIKPVYYHVSMTWTGLLLLLASFLWGLWTWISGRNDAAAWLGYLLNSGFVSYAIGFFVSMYASVVNWGGVPFSEPPVKQAIGYMIAGVLFWGATWWIKIPRLRGVVGTLAAGMVLMATNSSQSILHPESPVNTSPWSIRATFYGMFFLALALAAWSLNLQRTLSKQRLDQQEQG